MKELLTTLFLVSALATLILIIVLICIRLYEIFEEPSVQKRMRKLRKPVQPWVTVLIHGEFVDVCLKALSKSRYHNYDIVIAKDGSAKALKAAYRKSKHGKIVITLQSHTIVPPSFIKKVVANKGERKEYIVHVNKPISLHSLSGMIESLKNLFWSGSSVVRVSDAKNIMPIRQQVKLEFIGVLAFVAIILTSVLTQEVIIFWYSWLLVTGYLVAVIWLNEENISNKLKLTFSALSAMFLLPVASVLIGLSQFRSRN